MPLLLSSCLLPSPYTTSILLLSLSSIFCTFFAQKVNVTIDGQLLASKIGSNKTIIVGPNESFKSIQDAVSSVPERNSHWIIIQLRPGVYNEKVVIPRNKEYIFIRGNGRAKTSIVWNDSSTNTTFSSTFTVLSDNFIAFGISFKNTAPLGKANAPFNQSVAAMVAGDKAVFYNCGFYSAHNTLFDYKGRHYYEKPYIQGSIDFIFGGGQSLFQSSEIFVLPDKRQKIYGSIAAQSRQSNDDGSGFVFADGKIYGVDEVFLGRAKGAHSRVIFANMYLSKTIHPKGWTTWNYPGTTNNILFGEYQCYGPGAEKSSRVPWSRQLNKEEVAPFISINFINGKEWLPAYF